MNLSPLPVQKFFGNDGQPLVGGLLFTYIAGTTTKIATYTDSSGATPNSNPVVLDFRGEANVWLDATLTYKFVLSPRGDTDPPSKPIWSVDNITAAITIANLTQLILGAILWPPLPAEAGLTLNLRYTYGDVRRFGLIPNSSGDGVANAAALTAVLNPAVAGITGRIFFPNTTGNDLWYIGNMIQVRDGINIDLMQSTIVFTKTYAAADDFMGWLTFIRDVTVENGSINVVYTGVGSNNPGAVFRIGSRTGYPFSIYTAGIFDQDDLAAHGLPLMGGCKLRKLRIQSNNAVTQMVIMLGGLRNCEAEDIWLDGQALATYGFYYEFGFASTNGFPGTPAQWSSSHATNLKFKNIRASNMGAGAGYAISLIGAYSASHEEIYSKGNYGVCEFRPGEALFYRPWPGEDTAGAKRNMAYKNITGQDVTTNGMSLVGAEQPLGYLAGAGLTVYQQLDLMSFDVDGFTFKMAGGNGISVSGPCSIRSGRTTGCFNGIVLANECIQFDIDEVDVFDSVNVGIRTDGTSAILTRFKIGSLTNSYVAGSGGAGVTLDYTEAVTVQANRFGYNVAYSATAETTQTFGVSVGSNGFGAVVRSNYTGGAVGGIAYNKTGGPQNCIMQSPLGVSTIQGNWLHAAQLESILVFGGAITPDCSQGNEFVINVTTAGAFTINVPINPQYGQRTTYTIRNASGGALGVVTWNAIFKLAAWVQPLNTFSRSIDYKYNGTNWVEISRTTADVPN